ncbi:MAG: tetratricopeptide repeat protein [Betaproteobacteria bacterium]
MANQLDLEEQEQLDQLKHFWKQYGNAITWVLIVVLGGFASWNGYQYWQRNQAAQAAAMFDEVDRMVKTGDLKKIDRAFADMKDKYGSTAYGQQAALLVARQYVEAGQADPAKAALTWVVDKSGDAGYQAIARLRLAALLADGKAYDDALKQLGGEFPAAFTPLVADRKADILILQGKKEQARSEYEKAYRGFEQRTEYRRLVEFKLNALGVDPQPVTDGATAKGTP